MMMMTTPQISYDVLYTYTPHIYDASGREDGVRVEF